MTSLKSIIAFAHSQSPEIKIQLVHAGRKLTPLLLDFIEERSLLRLYASLNSTNLRVQLILDASFMTDQTASTAHVLFHMKV